MTAGINITLPQGEVPLIAGFGSTQLTLSGLVNAGLDGVITSGLSSAVYGTDFGAGVVDAITRAVVMGVAGAAIEEVADVYGHDTASFEKTIAKATVNCLAAQANGANCASGALGTLVVDLGLNDPNLLGAISQEDLQNRLELVAAIAGFFVSEGEAQNVNATVSASSLDFENNQALGNMSNFALGFQLNELNNRCTVAGGSAQDCAALQQAFISGSLQGQQEVAWLLLDFVPVVGDVKGILECIGAPSALTCGAVAASVVLGPGGDVARIVVRNGDNVLDMTVAGGKVTGGTKSQAVQNSEVIIVDTNGNALIGDWSSTKKLTAPENALQHWSKHSAEFPEFSNATQYANAAQDFVNNPPSGVLTKTQTNNGVTNTILYDPATNTFAVKSSDGVPRTMFRPTDGVNYWNRQ